jgi:hypothetical protein
VCNASKIWGFSCMELSSSNKHASEWTSERVHGCSHYIYEVGRGVWSYFHQECADAGVHTNSVYTKNKVSSDHCCVYARMYWSAAAHIPSSSTYSLHKLGIRVLSLQSLASVFPQKKVSLKITHIQNVKILHCNSIVLKCVSCYKH